jgi:hypothetical protein
VPPKQLYPVFVGNKINAGAILSLHVKSKTDWRSAFTGPRYSPRLTILQVKEWRGHVIFPFSPKILNECSLQIFRSSLCRSVTNQDVLMGVMFVSSVRVLVKTSLSRSFVVVILDLFIQLIKKFLCYATRTFRHLVTISGTRYTLDNAR